MTTVIEQKSNSSNKNSYSFIKSFQVDAILSLSELLTVILALNLQFFTDGLCSQVTVAGNVNDGNLWTCTYITNEGSTFIEKLYIIYKLYFVNSNKSCPK